MTEALFDYRIRVSRRARRVRLRVTPHGGLEVVLPVGYDASRVPGLLAQERSWIHQALRNAEEQRQRLGAMEWQVPSDIVLQAVPRRWRVTTQHAAGRSVSIRIADSDGLMLRGAIASETACRAALGRWLRREAGQYLVPRLRQLSVQTGLRYASATVRRQRTRWGSCSHRRGISLNAKLMFLPPELVDYVLIHELCHTVEMNHSARFWRLVARHSPEYRVLDRRLRDAWKAVPFWAS